MVKFRKFTKIIPYEDKQMKKTIVLSSFLIMSLFFNGCNNDKKQSQEVKYIAPVIPEKVIPENEYPLTDLNSKIYNIKRVENGFILEDKKDKIIILDIYATWCPPCRAATVHLSSLKEKYKDNLIIIGMTIEDKINNQKLKEFKDTYKINYTLVNSKQNKRLIKAVATSLEVGNRFPIPLMAMYKNGKLINSYVGAVEEEFIESDIKRALGK